MSESPPSPPVPEPASKPSRKKRDGGLPLWMPFLGLLVAFVFAIVAGVLVCPTLSGLALPPDPPLPPVTTTLVTHENKGSGLDEWLYSTNASGCQVAKYYQDRIGDCNYDPNSGCSSNGNGTIDPGFSYQVATCRGSQPIGTYKVFWTVYIGTNYKPGPLTQFRVIRELGN